MLDCTGEIDKEAIYIEQNGFGSDNRIGGYFHCWRLRPGVSLICSRRDRATIDFFAFQCIAKIAGSFAARQWSCIDAVEGALLLHFNSLDRR
jgi:hypothetical protein